MESKSKILVTSRAWLWFVSGALVLLALFSRLAAAHPKLNLFGFLLLMAAAAAAIVNAARSSRAIRVFWSMLAVSYALWSLNWLMWALTPGLALPAFLRVVTPLFLHTVFMIGAVASCPHIVRSGRAPYRQILNFLVLLFFWTFLYAFLIFPDKNLTYRALFVPYQIFYSVENCLLLVVLCVCVSQARSWWKSVYWHLLGATALYVMGSSAYNVFLMLRQDASSLANLPIDASVVWFLWLTASAQNRSAELAQSTQLRVANPRYQIIGSFFAMLTIVAIPMLGLWELLRSDELPARRSIRLAVVLVSVLVLALVLISRELLANRQLVTSLSGRLIDAQEEERKRIARELHDDYNQRVAMLAIDLARLAKNDRAASAAEDRSQSLRQISDRVRELGSDLHSLSHRLHPAALRLLGLVAAVKAFCKEFEEQQGVHVDFGHEDVPRNIPEEAQLCLFRIAQEGLRNIKRHSGANRAQVYLECFEGRLHLTISDQGRGFDSDKPPGQRGIGLRSMEERLRVLGGHLEINSRPLEGTRIDAWLPFQSGARRAA
jgi:signal transduction histidine kinase